MARNKSRILTEQQQKHVDGVMTGLSNNAAAIAAGYPNSSAPDKSRAVKGEIARAREQLIDLTLIKRLDVIEGIMDGIACARMQGDAGNMIKGWTEVAKILGHYAPEVKTINLTMDQRRLRSKFEALSDEELLAMQFANNIVDVDAKTVN